MTIGSYRNFWIEGFRAGFCMLIAARLAGLSHTSV